MVFKLKNGMQRRSLNKRSPKDLIQGLKSALDMHDICSLAGTRRGSGTVNAAIVHACRSKHSIA